MVLLLTGPLLLAQHCPWDNAGMLAVDIRNEKDPEQVISGLKVTVLDSIGHPLMTSLYDGEQWVPHTIQLWQNPEKTTHSGRIDNENPMQPDKIRFWFAEDNYVWVDAYSAADRKLAIRIEDIDKWENGGWYQTRTIRLTPDNFFRLCTDHTNWDARPERARMEGKFKPVQVKLTPFEEWDDPEHQVYETQWTAQWSPDDQYIAVGGSDKMLRIFDGTTFKILRAIPWQGEIFRVRWHPTQNILAVAASKGGTALVEVETEKIHHLPNEIAGSRSIAWDPDGSQVVIADYEGVLTVWTTKGESVRRIEKGTTKSYVGVAWHPFNGQIISLCDSIRMHGADGKLIRRIQHRPESVLLLCVEWHPSGDFFVVGDYGASEVGYTPLLQWRDKNGKLVLQSDLGKAEYRNVSWNTEGTHLATASDGLRIWTEEGKLLKHTQTEALLWGVDWSQSGKYIVTSNAAGNIHIWDKKGVLVTEMEK